MMKMAENNKPKAQFRNANLKAAVWENKTEKDGKITLQNTISIQKSYKDPKSNEWVNYEIRLFPSEIPQLISVAQQAYEECALKKTV
jgi:ribonucleotide reductase alpha subunit